MSSAYGLRLTGRRFAAILHGKPEMGTLYVRSFDLATKGPGRHRTPLPPLKCAGLTVGMACGRATEVVQTAKTLTALQSADAGNASIGNVPLARTLGGSLAGLLAGFAGPEREALLAAEPLLRIQYEPWPPVAELTFRKGQRLYSFSFQTTLKRKTNKESDIKQLAAKNVVLDAACIDALAAAMLEHNQAIRNTTSGNSPGALKPARRTARGLPNANGATPARIAPSRKPSRAILRDDLTDHPTNESEIISGRQGAQPSEDEGCVSVIQGLNLGSPNPNDRKRAPPEQGRLGL